MDALDIVGATMAALGVLGGAVAWLYRRHRAIVREARAEAARGERLDSADLSTSQQLAAMAQDVAAIRQSQGAQAVAMADLRGDVRAGLAELSGVMERHNDRLDRHSDRVDKIETRHEQESRTLWDEISQLRRGLGG